MRITAAACLVVVVLFSCKGSDGASGGLPGIDVADHAALAKRVTAVPIGATPDEVSSLLGAPFYATEGRAHYWRFRVLKARVPSPGAPAGLRYEVWMGEFAGGKLQFGTLVPPGRVPR